MSFCNGILHRYIPNIFGDSLGWRGAIILADTSNNNVLILYYWCTIIVPSLYHEYTSCIIILYEHCATIIIVDKFSVNNILYCIIITQKICHYCDNHVSLMH